VYTFLLSTIVDDSIMPSRPMNKGRSNDHDFVPPTQYKSSRTKQPRLSLLSQLEHIPKFEAMDLENVKGSSQVPYTSSPEDLFSLFFTDPILDRIIRCTNLNAERVRINPVATRSKNIRFHDSLNQLPWKPVISYEILAYLGTLIYMGIHVEPYIDDYWNTNEEEGPIHQPIRKTMSQHRWKQINRYFHIWDPALDQHCVQLDKVRPHEKVNPLWKLLSPSFQRYWKPGRDVAIDECIEGFTGRTSDIVNIPTKPTPIGFKIWVLADNGYVLDLLWHVRGDDKDQGPQGLRTTWKELGFSKTQAVVLELMTRMPNGGKGHTVWLEQNGGHLKFRKKLASQLMAHSSSFKYTSPIDGFGVRTNLKTHIVASKDGCSGTHEYISRTAGECKACMAQGRTAQACGKRKVLQELSENSIRFNQNGEKSRRPRPPRTKYGCSVCQIHLCKGGTCWEEHTQLSKLID